MDVRKAIFLEKLQVVSTVVVALGLVYWVIRLWFIPSDPADPITFLPEGSFGKLLLLGVVMWSLAVVAALTTTLSRPEGTLAAVLIALGGLSLRSHPMRPLMWSNSNSISGMFFQMIAEVLLMGVMLGIAAAIIICLRGLIARMFPRLMWCDKIGNLTGEQIRTLEAASSKFDSSWFLREPLAEYLLRYRKSDGSQEQKTDKASRIRRREQLRRTGGCLVAGIAIGLLLLSLLLRSTARGQVIFALFAAFMLAQIVAQQLYPTRSLLIACVTPFIASIPVYALGAYAGSSGGTNFWAVLAPQFQALPIDWLTAATSGSLLGLWTSDRMREVRISEILSTDTRYAVTKNRKAHT